MYLLFRKSLKMKQYNIYVRLNGGSGEVSYQCTTLAKLYDEQEAYEAACNELDEEDLAIIDETDIKELENWLDYKAVLTKEDNIEEDDLTLVYIIENGSFSKIDRK